MLSLQMLTTRSKLVGLVILRFSTGIPEHVALILSSMLTLSRIVSDITVCISFLVCGINMAMITNFPLNNFRDDSQAVFDVIEDVQVAPNTRERLPHSYTEEIREHIAEKECNDNHKKSCKTPGL